MTFGKDQGSDSGLWLGKVKVTVQAVDAGSAEGSEVFKAGLVELVELFGEVEEGLVYALHLLL